MSKILLSWKPIVATLLLVFCVTACTIEERESGGDVSDRLKAMETEVSQLKTQIAYLSNKVQALSAGAVKEQQLTLNDPYFMGAEDAKYAIVEYTDFQCPFCKRHVDKVFPDIVEKYIDTGKIKYAVRDFPLGFHKEAKQAAIVADCAGEQGKYWEMHKRLFAGAKQLGDRYFIESAEKLDLDFDKFVSCADSDRAKKAVETQFSQGVALGVEGTPRFYIGRIEGDKLVDVEVLSGARPFVAFEQKLDSLVK